MCPKCGNPLTVAGTRAKGQGKAAGAEQTKLSYSQLSILRILENHKAINEETSLPMKEVWNDWIHRVDAGQFKKYPSSHSVGDWLSGLCGAGFVTMYHRKCKVVDRETQTFRFVQKPTWALSIDYLNGRIGVDWEAGAIWRRN